MKNIVDKILGYLVKKETVDTNNEDELAFYRYGIEITLSSITNILVMLYLYQPDSIPEGIMRIHI